MLSLPPIAPPPLIVPPPIALSSSNIEDMGIMGVFLESAVRSALGTGTSKVLGCCITIS